MSKNRRLQITFVSALIFCLLFFRWIEYRHLISKDKINLNKRKVKNLCVGNRKPVSRLLNGSHTEITYEYNTTFFRKKLDCGMKPWQTLYKSYQTHLGWRSLESDKLKSSLNYTELKLIIFPAGIVSEIKVITKDRNNAYKPIGGDWWRVKLRGKDGYSSSIYMHDNDDGTYSGDFITKTPGSYVLTIFLEFTTWDGIRDPPIDFFIKGSENGHFQKNGIYGKMDQFQNLKWLSIYFNVSKKLDEEKNVMFSLQQTLLNQRKSMTKAEKYSDKDIIKNTLLYRPCGYWHKNRYREHSAIFDRMPKPGLQSKLETFIIYGDSLQYRLYDSLISQGFCEKFFRNCSRFYTWIYIKKKEELFNNKDFDEKKFLSQVKNSIYPKTLNSHKNVVLINFGLHVVRCLQMEKLLNLFKNFLILIKGIESSKNSPLIIWKETTPPRIENTKFHNLTRSRFMTKQRVSFWNAYTIQELRAKTSVPVLYAYDMALSYPNGSLDAAHFDNEFHYKDLQRKLIPGILKIYSQNGNLYNLQKEVYNSKFTAMDEFRIDHVTEHKFSRKE